MVRISAFTELVPTIATSYPTAEWWEAVAGRFPNFPKKKTVSAIQLLTTQEMKILLASGLSNPTADDQKVYKFCKLELVDSYIS